MTEQQLMEKVAADMRRLFEDNCKANGLTDPVALSLGRAILEAGIQQERQKVLTANRGEQ